MRDGAPARVTPVAFLLCTSLALTGYSCGSDDESPEPELVSDHLIISIGDSVASGEGNPDRPATLTRKAGWTSERCHRSRRSGHALAAMQVLGPKERGRLVLLGCSGATIRVGLMEPYEGIEPSPDDTLEDAQLDRIGDLAEDHTIDAILISVGANDVGFGRIVEFCIFHEPCWEKRFDPEANQPGPKQPLGEYIRTAISELATDYRTLHAALREIVPPERVILVEYFDPTSAPNGGDCEFLLGSVSPAESRWARERVLHPLNRQIRDSADAFGWHLVDGIDEKFRGHGICAGPLRWITTLRESVFGLGIPLGGSPFDRQTHRQLLASYKGTLHPNPAGHRATAELIVPVLRGLVSGG